MSEVAAVNPVTRTLTHAVRGGGSLIGAPLAVACEVLTTAPSSRTYGALAKLADTSKVTIAKNGYLPVFSNFLRKLIYGGLHQLGSATAKVGKSTYSGVVSAFTNGGYKAAFHTISNLKGLRGWGLLIGAGVLGGVATLGFLKGGFSSMKEAHNQSIGMETSPMRSKSYWLGLTASQFGTVAGVAGALLFPPAAVPLIMMSVGSGLAATGLIAYKEFRYGNYFWNYPNKLGVLAPFYKKVVNTGSFTSNLS